MVDDAVRRAIVSPFSATMPVEESSRSLRCDGSLQPIHLTQPADQSVD
jgi:hypothetical protein